ncbi:hypothetical protein BDV59DRAFT_202460 [Aspergillus ambiguus]|uniref:uncharacterized protein n=1 Tax=Aspergillus ambiguus TaxID=176160 RepID=UPI003CCCCB27
MVHTEIEIEAAPSVAREAFMNFAALPSYHTDFLKHIAPQNPEKASIEIGDKLNVTADIMTFSPVVEANTATEFTWRGTLGSTWVFTGAHTFKFLPAGENGQKTRFVHAEQHGGMLLPVLSLLGGIAKAEKGFQKFNEDFKNNGTSTETIELHSHSPFQPPRRATIWTSVDTWYRRTVLRSGKGYERLPERASSPRHFHGWRFGALISCIVVGTVLVGNIAITIYLSATYGSNADDDDIVVLMEGGCRKVKNVDSKTHYAINLVATILVCASNYNMQCLTAPTRREVSKAHREDGWMDVGVHSLRNLFHIGRTKTLLWMLLLMSSLPLHLLWNSAVYMTTTFNSFSGLVVTEDFVQSHSPSIGFDCSPAAMREYRSTDQERYVTCWLQSQHTSGNMDRMEPRECMRAYADGIEGTTFNLLAVTKADNVSQSTAFAPPRNATLPIVAYFHALDYPRRISDWCGELCNNWAPSEWGGPACLDHGWDGSSVPMACQQRMVNGSRWTLDALTQTAYWMCHVDAILAGDCSSAAAEGNSTHWSILPENYEIDYCLTTSADHLCQLQYSRMIISVAVGCNAVKFLCILLCLLISREPILATVGDAVESFLRQPEPKSEGRCLMSLLQGSLLGDKPVPKMYPPQPEWKERWYQGSSSRRWGLCVLLWMAAVLVGVYFLCESVSTFSVPDSFSAGLGALSLSAIVNISQRTGGSTPSLVTTSLIANLPQLLLSGLYFGYNAVMTGMYSAYEWSLFIHRRTTLRVTLPHGAQRETYWLQLPWRYSLPLGVCCTAFHWLISQSIFLINLRIYQANNELLRRPDRYFPSASRSGVITACGYSPLAILLETEAGNAGRREL